MKDTVDLRSVKVVRTISEARLKIYAECERIEAELRRVGVNHPTALSFMEIGQVKDLVTKVSVRMDSAMKYHSWADEE